MFECSVHGCRKPAIESAPWCLVHNAAANPAPPPTPRLVGHCGECDLYRKQGRDGKSGFCGRGAPWVSFAFLPPQCPLRSGMVVIAARPK